VPPQPPKQIAVKNVMIVLLVVVLVAIGLIWWQGSAICAPFCDPPPDVEAAGEPTGLDPAVPQGELIDGEVAILEQRWAELTGDAPAWPDDLATPSDCDSVENDLVQICELLDGRPYVRKRVSGGGICAVLRQVGEELGGRPPEIASELRSYGAILANVHYLFRTVGRQRLELLREVVRQEGDLAEPLAMAAYRWLASRQTCAGEMGSAIGPDSLYEYACFATTTMGGQAYLRRRAPRTEALVTFYALLILDRAIEDERNPHGLDPRAELVRCRELISRQPLVFRDRYLETLETIERRWESRLQ